MAARQIGRFDIVRELGRGAQGAVYLAFDPQLERQVAIKTLRPGAPSHTERLQREARIVSKLQHPNIVPLYDTGAHDGVPYLVSAYIDGGTLAQMLKSGALPQVRSVEIVSALLEALESAHQQGVLHLDIKPGNIMLGGHGKPMLMDFGIARQVQEQRSADEELSGSPQYMAPECISGEPVAASADLYSLGIVLYEMVTGRAPFNGENVFHVMNQVAHEPVPPPSSINPQLDARLDAIIRKATSKRRDDRYADAASMRNALKEFLLGAGEGEDKGKHSTLDFLLRRMRSKSDFPALSSIISEINAIVASESESASKLAQVILQDFALTNKLLKQVNTASYGQFGGKINTISKAVMIVGFDTVRNIAMSLILLEYMQNRALAMQLKDDVVGSFFAGVVASQLSGGQNLRDGEELMICSMFFSLGRLLVTYYFFEEGQEIARLIEQGLDEDKAAIKVLGLTYNELGIGVAKSWNFPQRLLDGMVKLPAGDKLGPVHSSSPQLQATVNMANELCQIAAASVREDKAQALKRLRSRYREVLDVPERALNEAIERGLGELSHRAMTLGINTSRSKVVDQAKRWTGHAIDAPKAEEGAPSDPQAVHGIESILQADKADASDAAKPDPDAVLSAGIQDVTNTLVEDYDLNDVLLMVLETMYRALGFKHALICVRDNKRGFMQARIGLGDGVDRVVKNFRFNLAFEPDVFHLALKEGADIVIEDVQAGGIASKIPAWYRDLLDAQSFILLPLAINKVTVGLFYADMEMANSLKLSEKQLSLLRTLRNQAVLAIKQKM